MENNFDQMDMAADAILERNASLEQIEAYVNWDRRASAGEVCEGIMHLLLGLAQLQKRQIHQLEETKLQQRLELEDLKSSPLTADGIPTFYLSSEHAPVTHRLSESDIPIWCKSGDDGMKAIDLIQGLIVQTGRLGEGVKRMVKVYESDFDDPIPHRPKWLTDLLLEAESSTASLSARDADLLRSIREQHQQEVLSKGYRNNELPFFTYFVQRENELRQQSKEVQNG